MKVLYLSDSAISNFLKLFIHFSVETHRRESAEKSIDCRTVRFGTSRSMPATRSAFLVLRTWLRTRFHIWVWKTRLISLSFKKVMSPLNRSSEALLKHFQYSFWLRIFKCQNPSGYHKLSKGLISSLFIWYQNLGLARNFAATGDWRLATDLGSIASRRSSVNTFTSMNTTTSDYFGNWWLSWRLETTSTIEPRYPDSNCNTFSPKNVYLQVSQNSSKIINGFGYKLRHWFS